MPSIKPLAADRLHSTFDPVNIPWESSDDVPLSGVFANDRSLFQPRAMQALDLAIQISQPGYNVYLSGDVNLGRSYMLKSYLEPVAAKMPTPLDLVYVHNFAEPDCPVLLRLPPGQGKKLKFRLKEFIQNIGKNLEDRLESSSFAEKREELFSRYQSLRAELLTQMSAAARRDGFNLEFDENNGFSLSVPDKPDNSPSSLSENALRQKMRKKGEKLTKKLAPKMRELAKMDNSFQEEMRSIEHKAMEETLQSLFAPFEREILEYSSDAGFISYLGELRKDILENTVAFLPADAPHSRDTDSHAPEAAETDLRRYEANVFVDNSSLKGAPIITEENPTAANLLGCLERESEMGTLVTDYTLIRSGSLHRANGGFLILHIEDLLRHSPAWEGLLRAMRSNVAVLEENSDFPDMPVRTKGVRPEAIQLDVKIILIGDEDLYETLLFNEDRFSRIFRIKAHMTSEADKTPANIEHYLFHLARIVREASLLPFDRGALAWLVDLGSHLCEDQRRLSLQFPLLREYMIEANALAQLRNQKFVTAKILEDAYANRAFRENLVEFQFLEEYDRELINVATSGAEIGQVNGLSVSMQGLHEFGLPHRISCAVGVGHDGIIDLEREAELGGPIHTKAMMILKSYLTRMFASKKPLVLSASLYFEQNYAEIEGDSASGAELAALISALANVPARLDLAFTGAVSHTGEIMAVGGVTRKIEGFYKICRQRGLTGSQGVIIPAANADHLMLAPEILTSVRQKEFAIYPVKTIDDALQLLTGMPVGKKLKNGGFSAGTLFNLADKRLELLGSYAENAFGKTRKSR